MSYYSEIVLLEKNNNGNSFFIGDLFDVNGDISEDNIVWTEISTLTVKIIDKSKKCCIQKNNKTCVADYGKMYKDSTLKNITTLSSGSKKYTTEDYDISLFSNGQITEEDQLLCAVVATRVIYLDNTYSSVAKVLIAGQSDSTEININLNSVIIGKIIFSKGSTSGIINIYTKTQVSPGDVLSITSSSNYDTSCENFMITIVGKSEREV